MDEMIVITSLDHKHGCFQFSDALNYANQMAEAGFSVVAETAPGAPLDGINVFYLKCAKETAMEAKAYFEENIIKKKKK